MKKRKTLLEGGKRKGSLPPTRRDKVNTAIRKIENRVADTVNPYSDPVKGIINTVGGMQVGDKVVDPNAINLLHGANNTLNNIVRGTVGALIPGGSTPLRDKLEQRRARQSRAQEAYDENVEDLSRVDERKDMAEGGEGMTAEEAMKVSIKSLVNDEEKNYPKKIINESLNRIVDNAANEGVNRTAVIDALKAERNRRFEERREAAIEANPLLEKRQIRNEGGELDDQMSMLMEAEETHTMPDGTVMPGATHEEYEEQTMLPDEEMEEDYVEYVFDSTLNPQDKEYLENALAEDAKLSEIIDRVVESATEFSGSGPIEGPGNEKSDSIPARLSDGEFVITAKATEEIGSDNLMSMMKDAEAAADERQSVAYGGMIDEEDQAVPIPTTASRAAQGNVPNVVKQSRQVEEEMLKSSPRRYYVPVSG